MSKIKIARGNSTWGAIPDRGGTARVDAFRVATSGRGDKGRVVMVYPLRMIQENQMDIIVLIGLAVIVVLYLYDKFETKDSNKSRSTKTRGRYKDSPLSAEERRLEYRKRGKSPSGVIDGVYNDMYRENGRPYSDVDRDWDAEA